MPFEGPAGSPLQGRETRGRDPRWSASSATPSPAQGEVRRAGTRGSGGKDRPVSPSLGQRDVLPHFSRAVSPIGPARRARAKPLPPSALVRAGPPWEAYTRHGR